MIKIISVVGARPNFMKVAPLHRAFVASGKIDSRIVHTGQHYDARMSDIFFNQLGLPEPHHYLGVGGGSHTYQKANVMLKFETVLLEEKPDLLLVVGDVNATSAATLVATKMGIPVAHVEAGLRSNDRKMPEEINRVVTDSISQYHFVTEHSGLVNLARENTMSKGIHLVGNVMIDSLIHFRRQATEENVLTELSLISKAYILMTMHRPQNVDNEAGLRSIIDIIKRSCAHMPVVFPMHPRTKNNLEKFELYDDLADTKNLCILEPQGYLQFLNLMDNARLIITDSGGIQEETTYLQVPCLTFRSSTERPITVELGTNILMQDLDPDRVMAEVEMILDGFEKKGVIPPLWDGLAAERITDVLLNEFETQMTETEQT